MENKYHRYIVSPHEFGKMLVVWGLDNVEYGINKEELEQSVSQNSKYFAVSNNDPYQQNIYNTIQRKSENENIGNNKSDKKLFTGRLMSQQQRSRQIYSATCKNVERNKNQAGFQIIL